MSNKALATLERWAALITSLIAIAGTIRSGYTFVIQNIPVGWADYLLLIVTVFCYMLTIYIVMRPKHVKYEFLSNVDDIEQHAKFIKDCKNVRFRGLRFYEALKNQNFINSLRFPNEIRLHVMTKYPTPVNNIENDHNKKYDATLKIIRGLRAKGVQVIVRESPGCPEYNILIFDSNIVRRRKYDKNLLSAKNSQSEIYYWHSEPKEIKKIIDDFESAWTKATYVDVK